MLSNRYGLYSLRSHGSLSTIIECTVELMNLNYRVQHEFVVTPFVAAGVDDFAYSSWTFTVVMSDSSIYALT